MTLDLLKRSETGSANLTVTQHDANFSAIEAEVNSKIGEGDPRLNDARTPTAHTHTIANVTGLQTALDAKATTASLTALQESVVLENDLSSTAGAAMVGIADAGGYYTETTAEAALQKVGAELAQTLRNDGVIDVTFSNGATTGPVKVPAIVGSPIVGGVLIFDATFGLVPSTVAALKALMFPSGVVGETNLELGQTYWQEGGGATASAPGQFDAGGWTLANPATTGDLTVTLTTLPSPGSSAITNVQYDLAGSGSWVSLSGYGGTGTYTISGLTDNVLASVRLRAVNAVGNGPASTAKTATPTPPAAYTTTLMDNQGTAGFTINQEAWSGDTKFLTFAFHGKFNTGPTAAHKLLYTSSDRVRLQYNYTTGTFGVRVVNASATTIGDLVFAVSIDALHTIAVSLDMNTAAIDIRRDGVALSNTGSTAGDGYQIITAFGNAIIDWDRPGGAVGAFGLDSSDFVVGELFVDNTRALATSLFRDGAGLTDWAAIANGTEAIFLGSGLNAAGWNAAGANNTGYIADADLINSGTFVAV